MRLADLEHKKILILGYGKEGRATETFLRANVPTAVVSTADQQDGPDYLKQQQEVDIVIKTPGIPPRLITKPYTTGTNLFHAYLEEHNMANMIVGVTGSKGKSTTASLIAAVLRQNGKKVHLIGNIGTPALSVLEQPIGSEDIFVMELSSYQCEDMDWSPNISVITSIFPEHLDYHGDFDSYLLAKKNIIAHARPEDVLVYNPSYTQLRDLAAHTHTKTIPYTEVLPFDVSAARLQGLHNVENMRGAFTVAHYCGIADNVVQKVFLAFEPLPHRMQEVGVFRNIRFIDDAIATAPEPTIFAIQSLGDVDTILLGGTNRGYDFTLLARTLRQHAVRNVVLFPESGSAIEAAIAREFSEKPPRLLRTSDMEEAVRFAYEHTKPGKSCLLSSASPSYSLWKNFEEKGDQFTAAVVRLGR